MEDINECTHKAFVEMGLNDIATDPIKVILDPTDSGDMGRLSMSSAWILSRQRKPWKRRQRQELAGLRWLLRQTQLSHVVAHSDYWLHADRARRSNPRILSDTQSHRPLAGCLPHCRTCQNSLNFAQILASLRLSKPLNGEQHGGCDGDMERGSG